MTEFTSASRATERAPRTASRWAIAPPMSWPATRSGVAAPSASRKRSTQAVSAGTVAVAAVSSPPERPQPGRSTATGRSPAAASGAITGFQTRLQ